MPKRKKATPPPVPTTVNSRMRSVHDEFFVVPDFERRIGFIRVKKAMLNTTEGLHQLRAAMQQFVPFSTWKPVIDTDEIHIWGCSPFFDPVPDNVMAPEYTVVIKQLEPVKDYRYAVWYQRVDETA